MTGHGGVPILDHNAIVEKERRAARKDGIRLGRQRALAEVIRWHEDEARKAAIRAGRSTGVDRVMAEAARRLHERAVSMLHDMRKGTK